MDGVREMGLLESAIAAPFNVYHFDEGSDIFDMSASLLYSLAMNHPFNDGNKRTATYAAVAFLDLNGWYLDMEPLLLTLLVEHLVMGSCNKLYVADLFFLGCARHADDLFRLNVIPPESYKSAQSEAERHAIVVDTVTAAFRIKVLGICSQFFVKPERFDRLIDRLEEATFRTVENSWRRQFGML